MSSRIRVVLLCAALVSGSAVTAARAEDLASAADVRTFVGRAAEGDARAAEALQRWAGAVRAGDPGPLAVAAQVLTDGIRAAEGRIDDAERQAAAGGWDPRTGYVRSVVAGTGRVTAAQAATFVHQLGPATGVATAEALTQPLNVNLAGQVVLATVSSSNLDPDDLVFEEIEQDTYAPAGTLSERTVCKDATYHDALFGYTIAGMQVCITWKYDHERYVSNGRRTITQFLTLWGSATGWRWMGTVVATSKYFNYKRVGPRSGYATRTVGHFQRCPVAVVVPYCDQDRFPHISLNGHFDGTHGAKVTP